jgi:arginyl-tRNA synthetase
VLDEAIARAEQLVRASEADPAKRRGFDEEQIRQIARAVGIGAVKYADLSQNRTSDYVFSWDKMLAMDGNTAPYLMYAYARIRSIYAKSSGDVGWVIDPPLDRTAKRAGDGPMQLREPAELKLAKQILQFAETIDAVADELRPNVLTSYLYDVAGTFMGFYENCPVLKADTPELRASRLRLCELAARTLRTGLGLLGIDVVERM